MLLREDLGRRHERDLESVLHRHQGRHHCHDRLPRADVPLEQPVHRLRPLHVLDDFGDHLLLIARELEWEYPPRGLADVGGDRDGAGLALGGRVAAAHHHPELEEEELLEDQAPLRRRAEGVEIDDRRAGGRKVHVEQRLPALDQLLPDAHLSGQRIGHVRRQLRERLVHNRPLHLRRERPGFLVDGDDAAGVQGILFSLRRGVPRVFVAFRLQDFVLRVEQLQPVRRELELSEEDDALMRSKHVTEERLVEEDGAQGPGAIAHEHLENLEARSPGRADAAGHHLPHDGRGGAGPQRGDRLKRAAVLVAGREPVEQIFDRVEADALQIGGTSRADPLEELERRVERDHDLRSSTCEIRSVYCTTTAVPVPTRISRMRAGSSNGSSMLMPDGFSAVRE